jgi:hypothetical protein
MAAEQRTASPAGHSHSELLTAIEQTVALVQERLNVAIGPSYSWVERVRDGLAAFLEVLDEHPELARRCVVEALAGSPQVLARRAEVLERLARVVDEGRSVARRQPPPLTAMGVVSGVLGVVHARLLEANGAPLSELLNPLMSFLVMPYLGRAAARMELHRPATDLAATARGIARPRQTGRDARLTPRTLQVLAAIAAQPGLSNSELSMHAGVIDQGQISKLLARLARRGLIESRATVATHSWRLTPEGYELVTSLGS